jgi:hypothetical protein
MNFPLALLAVNNSFAAQNKLLSRQKRILIFSGNRFLFLTVPLPY